jgi:phosphoglycolate phosphatase-like HAD superfamily hydrolase
LDDLALIVFDVDGTLVDSQSEILAAMHDAFAAIAQPVPNPDAVLSTVGLSLEQAMLRPYSISELRIYCANADRMKIGCLGLPRESRAAG